MIRFPAYYLTLALYIASSAIVVAAGWFVLSAFLGLGTYIESVIP
jgi:hypothetical protein